MASIPLGSSEEEERIRELEEEHEQEHEEADEVERQADEPDPDSLESIRSHEEADEQSLAAAHQEYLRAVMFHFGDDASIFPCPLCESRGYVDAELRPDPEVAQCEACAGMGRTATGSKVDGNADRPCVRCRGAGYASRPGAAPAPTAGPPRSPMMLLPPTAFPPAAVTAAEPGFAG